MNRTKNVIRSTFNTKGHILKCIERDVKGKTEFLVQNNFQFFYRTKDIYKALLVFEALALEDTFDLTYIKMLDQEMKQNDLYYFSSAREWEKTILHSVSQRKLGLRKINDGRLVTWKKSEEAQK